ncbi:MAG: hypothetical protein D6705_01600 [Deltaproteobacteria bacterium]|nr:MAG: hypothetical protein D6705_01600 [Deltaproteobacteria bacterium]
MAVARGRITVAVALLVALGVGGAILAHRCGREGAVRDVEGGADDEPPLTYAAYRRAVGGVPPRPHQPAIHRREGTWLPGSDPARFAQLPVADPVALSEREDGWDPLLGWLVGLPVPNPGSIGRHHCAVTVLSGVLDASCQVDLRLFLEREPGAASGRIVGIAPSDPDDRPSDPCAEYVRCVEPTFLGDTCDWPEPAAGDEHLVVRYQQVVSGPTGDARTFRTRVENILPLLRRTLGELSADTPKARLARDQLEDLIDYYEWYLAQDEP